ncbi:hypothetical protein Nepgr_016189 [Nepenthes gracilis]|uniref:Uncharacterized protein n=1 Tax=Nepenthes gracilis TaxID=150966 RepID=A0AAD3SN44_NEPGR|nr:hypothetical protein Nepgr_016189 [Nepenthes gracilis]
MWRLKIAERTINENSIYINSTNNYAGRQVWEFDPNYGSPEERAKIDEARLTFYKNRFTIKPSSDLLLHFQLLRENNFKQTIAPMKVGDEEITFEKVQTIVKRAVHYFSTLQASDGHWPAEISGNMFYMPPLNVCKKIHGQSANWKPEQALDGCGFMTHNEENRHPRPLFSTKSNLNSFKGFLATDLAL